MPEQQPPAQPAQPAPQPELQAQAPEIPAEISSFEEFVAVYYPERLAGSPVPDGPSGSGSLRDAHWLGRQAADDFLKRMSEHWR